jgi:undecaprenyl pyrophosphate phosphatase UppP
MNAYIPLLHLHSTLRYAVLILLIIAIAKALAGWLGRKEFTKADNKIGVILLALTHTQLLLGIILYFFSPTVEVALANMAEAMKDPNLRFWAVEHTVGMLIAVVCVTLGRILSKKATDPKFKHRRAAVWFSVAFAIIIYMIPWAERGFFAGSGQ